MDDKNAAQKTPDEFQLRLTSGVKMTVPDEIAQWLGRTLLLYGVPFNYLVPDERMLPDESIRFFHLDPGWLKCLLEGACSIGRTTTREQSVDQQLSRHFLARAPAEAAALRQGPGVELAWPLTGFLLRSRMVEGWQGLEMTASGRRPNGEAYPLRPLRIDRLGPDIMLAIFNGRLARIVVKQPPEGMHFGASPSGQPNGYQKITLRRVNAVGDAAKVQECKKAAAADPGREPSCEPGDQILGAPVELPMREGIDRVVDISSLKALLEKRLRQAEAMDPGEAFTSAEFALQMVDSPGMAIFTPTDKEFR